MRKTKYLMGDFETTVYDNQKYTEVWASAVVELFTEDVKVFHSIGETFDYLISLNSNVCIYYHNLKFDGSFWLSYLLVDLGFKQAYNNVSPNEEYFQPIWLPTNKMKNKTFKYVISEMGFWYRIIIKVNNKTIEIRDSLKLLPFSVKRIGESFKTKHKKLDMEYEGFRYAGCEITEKEKEYIKNDVLVVKEALEIMFSEGHNKLTIGSCCLSEYKKIMGRWDYEAFYPNIYSYDIDEGTYGKNNAGEYIRKSYKGGWCYLAKGKENKIFKDGTTADVNSLYPSMMHSESGNRYPYGLPHFWSGNYIPKEAERDTSYYFVRIRTRFYLKEGKLPFIQIKDSLLYKGTECLETSDYYDNKTKKYYKYYRENGDLKDTRVTLTLTMTDFILMREHYNLEDFEILDGCWFWAQAGIFDEYIEKYKKIKLESKGAMRELAKLFLNNLYGKMASNTNSSFKVAYVRDDNSIGFMSATANEKEPGYIPVGSAITSYARNFTIRAAQKNYHGKDKPGFIYADTDSIHCDLPPDKIKGIKVHDKNFCCWKLESCWDEAIFVRQKTYIEHVVMEDLKPIDNPYYNIKCAGMPQRCKDLFELSMRGVTGDDVRAYNGTDKKINNFKTKLTEDDEEFLKTKRELTDFKRGLIVPGKLLPCRIKGGTVLLPTTYEMRY